MKELAQTVQSIMRGLSLQGNRTGLKEVEKVGQPNDYSLRNVLSNITTSWKRNTLYSLAGITFDEQTDYQAYATACGTNWKISHHDLPDESSTDGSLNR